VTPPAGLVPARPTSVPTHRSRFPPDVSTLRFPRRAHLRASAEFQAVFGEGSRVSGPSLRLHVRFAVPDAAPRIGATADAGARLGLTVSKRVDARSVGRNRIRRILRETFRLTRALLTDGDYVVLAKPEAKKLDGAALRAELADLLRRAVKRGPSATVRNEPGASPASPDTAASLHVAPLPGSAPDGTMPGPSPTATAPSDPSS
jgi:ribonuclease P protein component